MRATRSRTGRLPLKTIPTQNDQKVKKEPDAAFVKLKTERLAEERTETLPLDRKVEPAENVQPVSSVSHALPASGTSSSPWKSRNTRKRHASPTVPAKVKVEKLDTDPQPTSDSDSDSEEELDYEKLRERNLRDNEEFFSSLGIAKAKEELQLSNKKPARPYKKREPKPQEVLPRRQSRRLQRIDPQGQPLPPEPEPVVLIENEHPRVPSGPLQMGDILDEERKGVEENHALIASGVTSIDTDSCVHKVKVKSAGASSLTCLVSEMKKMQITRKAKLCKDRLFSVALHPSSTKVLAMAGDKWGRLGFWDIDSKSEDTVTVYRPHSRPIGHIYVPPSDPHKVYTCSYDSTLRCGDFEKGVFDEIYSVPEEEDDLFRNFDFLSPSTLLLAQFRGNVSVVDIRTPGKKAEMSYYVCDKYLRTVSVSPLDKNFFITAGTDMQVSVWDIRKLKAKGNKPLHSLTHGRAVSSAYFSPLTGGNILTCSADDTLNIYSCSSNCGEVKRTKTIHHNNKTGRWLTPFRAVWHPVCEDVFFVGSMKTPRRMEAFGVDGRLLHEFQGELLSSVCSVVQFHPSRPILVGGNSSGYVFPFM